MQQQARSGVAGLPSALVAARRGQWVWLEVEPANCRRCASGTGCGAALLGRNSTRLLRAKAQPLWTLGMQVRVPALERPLGQLAWTAYGAPLIGLLTGMLVATGLAQLTGLGAVVADVLTVLGAGAGAWTGAKLLPSKLSKSGRNDCPL